MIQSDDSIKPHKIDMNQLSLSVFEVVKKVERGNIKLKSKFQRQLSWDTDLKATLIESILLEMLTSPIILSEEENGEYDILDGRERIIAIYEFVNNKFKLDSKLLECNGKFFKELHPSMQRKIEDYKLYVFIIKKDNNEVLKDEMFERINARGKKLSSQELRSL